MRVLQIGNVGQNSSEYSTENDLRRTLESMACDVLPLHERGLGWAALGQALDRHHPDWCLWTTTPSWSLAPEVARTFLATCRARAIPVVGLHLDLWRGLRERHSGFNSHPYFGLDYLLTPDGSPAAELEWKRRGVNHVWSPPGILEASCYLAPADQRQAHDVIFVGALGYHEEHPRRQLLEWLAYRYGLRFKLYEHSSAMRGHRLNVLYASARVVAGDSCFAGRPGWEGYWSDRLPETLGRGGRLVFPQVVDLPADLPCRTYRAGDFDDLGEKIEDALTTSDTEAHAERLSGVAWALAGHTYRHRVEAIIARLRADGALVTPEAAP